MKYANILKRRKIAYVSPEEIMGYFGNWKNKQYIVIKEFKDYENATITNIWFDYPRNMFGIELIREDWPIIQDGEIPELINGICEHLQEVKLNVINKVV